MADGDHVPGPREVFGLCVPHAQAVPDAHLDLRPKAIERWLRELPLADAQQSAAKVSALLQVVNDSELAPNLRFRIAEQLRETVHSLAQALGGAAGRRGFPIAERVRPLADQARAVLMRLTDAYKLVAVGTLCAGSKPDVDLLGHASQRALRSLEQILLLDYQLYAPVAGHTWRELHRLFALAENHGIDQRAVADPLVSNGRESVGRAYRGVLLLALSNPYRFRVTDLPALHQVAHRYAETVVLEKDANTPGFYVALDGDRPPAAAAAPANHARRIGLDAAAATAQRHLDQQRDDLLSRLLPGWIQPARRQHGRSPHHAQVRLVFGLGATAWILERGAADADVDRESGPPGAAPLELTTEAPNDSAAHRHWDSDNDRHFAATLRSSAVARRRSPLPAPVYHEHCLQTLDVSARGYCLMWEADTVAPAKIGEVLTLWDGLSGRWTVGVVRWMQSLRNRGVKIGIQMIAPRAQPARIQRGDREDTALHLPATAALGECASVLTPTDVYRSGNTVQMRIGGCAQRIRLTQVLESNRSFVRFSYDAFGEAVSAPTGARDDPSLATTPPV